MLRTVLCKHRIFSCAPPTEEDTETGFPSYMWLSLYFQGDLTGRKRASKGTPALMEGVSVNVITLKAKTLLPAGGQFVSHWKHLAARRVDPASVSTWLRIEDPNPNVLRKSKTLWFIPGRVNPLGAALHERTSSNTYRSTSKSA